MMFQQTDMLNAIRDITDDEVAFFEEHGWVKLPQLIQPSLAAEILEISKKIVDDIENKTIRQSDPTDSFLGKCWNMKTPNWKGILAERDGDIQLMRADDIKLDPFQSLALSKDLGRASHRLINRMSFTDQLVPIGHMGGALLCKPGGGAASTNGTFYHQDNPAFDRIGVVAIWIALDEVTPEQGAMRFLDRSHRAGPLGGFGESGAEDLLERYPKLIEQYPLSPPLHYEPGDATVHHQMIVHGAPANGTSKTRWAFVCTYRAMDCVGLPCPSKPGIASEIQKELPIVYP